MMMNHKAKYQMLINKLESVDLKHCGNIRDFIDFSNDMDNIYENADEFSPNKKRKISNVFDYIITDKLNTAER